YLLKQGASVNAVSTQGNTPLFEAILHLKVEVVKCLLNESALDFNTVYAKRSNRTALMLGVDRRNMKISERESAKTILTLLLRFQNRFDENAQDSGGYTTLCLAAVAGFKDGIIQLLDCGFQRLDLNIKTKSGHAAMTLAAIRGNEEIVNLLLSDTVTVSLENGAHGTAIQRAVEFGHSKVVGCLLDDYLRAK
ncbi:hypothetical protein MMC25_000247, partial [Agyrium rufum]|nr:hypothetical protein [Agyrium rufum]